MRWAVVSLLLLALILVPFVLFEGWFDAFAGQLVRREASTWYVAAAIAGLLASDVFLPIPSSVVAAASGLLLGLWTGTAVVWVGMMTACILGYGFGARLSGSARRFVGDQGVSRAEYLYERFGDYALVLCRPVPVLAESSVIFAGLVRQPFRRFLYLTGGSSFGVAFAYAAIGAFSMRVESFFLAFAGSIALPAAALLFSRLWLLKGRSGG